MEAATWTAIGLLGAASLGTLFYLGARIDALAARFAHVEQHFDRMDDRFDRMVERFDVLTSRVDSHLGRHAG